MKFNQYSDYGVSFGKDNLPEVWHQDTLDLPQRFEVLSDTDLYELCDLKVLAAEFSSKHFVVLTKEKLFIFDAKTLKLLKSHDETIKEDTFTDL
jgi:hypothetical protein